MVEAHQIPQSLFPFPLPIALHLHIICALHFPITFSQCPNPPAHQHTICISPLLI
jgi:hypothetical protein